MGLFWNRVGFGIKGSPDRAKGKAPKVPGRVLEFLLLEAEVSAETLFTALGGMSFQFLYLTALS